MRKYIQCLLGILFLLTGCYDDELFTRKPEVEEGILTRVSLKYQVEANQVITRAAQDDEYEFRVENMYIMVFDGSGNRLDLIGGKNFFTNSSGLIVNNGNNSNPTKGTVTFNIHSVNNARIVGIANLTSGETATAYTVLESDLDGVKTLDELRQVVLNMSQSNSVERGGLFLMTGYAVDADGNKDINISATEGEGEATLDCTLKLERADAKVQINMASEASDVRWKDFSFEPKTWQVMQVPSQILLLSAEAANTQGNWDADGTYFDTPARVFEVVDKVEEDNKKLFKGGSFVFYMPENRKHYKKEIIETDAQRAYALRDKCLKEPVSGTGKPGQTEQNAAFEYAHDNSTYLILTGHVSYLDENSNEVNADVRYYIHLGYATGNANDYETKRNGFYTYNVIVKGIDNIIVEVENANEVRPGYEGDVIYSTNEIFELDSHYDRCLLEIAPDLVSDDMTWGVKTPFCSGIHTPGSTDFTGVEDYKWIKFAINKEYGYSHGQYVKYPGDQNYDDPDKMDDGISSPSYPNYSSARLLDVNQLIEHLKQAKSNGTLSNLIPEGSDHICITAFVDENLYFINPLTGQTGAENRSLWKESVDKEDRQLHIIIEPAQYSPDGNSSKVNSLYTFTQKAIRTVFNVEKNSLETAWGLESVMETERLEPGNVSTGSSTSNGRTNTISWLENKNWTTILNTSDKYGLNRDYQTAAYACLMRNRDLNGDNVIDKNEIRWYLASIDQLTDIYLGEYALDEASRLYPQNAIDRPGGNSVYWHYTSSSYNSTDKAAWVLWAEEGASRGSYGGNYGSKALNGSKYSYRCVRNLGLSLDNPDEEPADLIEVIKQSNGNYLIDATNMSVKARRTNMESVALPLHDERNANNRPYAKFEVGGVSPTPDYEGKNGGEAHMGGSTEDETDLIWKNLHEWNYYQTADFQSAGYRIPNQRELLIMSTRLPSEAWPTYTVEVFWYEGWWGGSEKTKEITKQPPYYISQTSFSMDGQSPYNNSRDGFIWRTDGNVFMLQNSTDEKGYVRLIRDVAE